MMKVSTHKIQRRVHARVGKVLLFLMARVAHRLPLSFMLALGRGLGRCAPLVSPRHLRRIANDLATSFPEYPARQIDMLARKTYQRLSESLIEFLRLPYMSAEEIRQWARLEGAEHIETALARGKGVLLLTAHLGNWEICGTRMGVSPYPTTSIAREQQDSAVTDLFTHIRQAHGQTIVSVSDVRECIRVLKRNECLGVLGDVNARVPGAFIQFFGRPAATYTGVAYLAQVTGATILPVFDERLPDNTHRIYIGPSIPTAATGDRQRDLLITTMRCQHIVQEEIRRRPYDWYWLIQRWKTRPEHVPQPERIPMEHRDLTREEVALALEAVDNYSFAVTSPVR